MKNKILLCKPTYYDVSYSINPWMTNEVVNKTLALKQWNQLRALIGALDVSVSLMDQSPKFPDMVFTANAGVVFENKVVLSNFKHKQRRGEKSFYKEWFLDNNYEVIEIPSNLSFEGCGDVVISKDLMIGGYGFRTDLKSLKYTSKKLNLDLIYLKLIDPKFYHLDTCFCLLSENLALYNPEAFSEYTIRKLSGIELIPVTKLESEEFLCNSLVIGKNIIMPSESERLTKILSNRGFEVYTVNTSEFLKSGGSIQCMCLWL